ncbi:hypothetical protein FDZ74_09140 [bacterium]|nr:MAG: hypothetical protein FDZ74_09140 [bacterium]
MIKSIRVYYMDPSATENVSAYLPRYQSGQNSVDLTATSSTLSFTGGWGTALSMELNEIVDNMNYAYTLIGWPSTTGTTEQICGIRVAYYAPLGPSAYLPAIRK